MTKEQALQKQFEKAVGNLREVLNMSKDDIVRDSAIKRFEIAFDLSWEVLKELLEVRHTVRCASPKTCFREAYKQKLIPYDDEWITLADVRNETAHTYKEQLAEEVYAKLPDALKKFQELCIRIKGTP